MSKKPITRLVNVKPISISGIKTEQKEDGLFMSYTENIISQIVEAREEKEFEFICSQIQEFIEKENISACFVINKTELVDCLQEHQKLKMQIADLEAKLAEKEDRINWLVEAEFNRKWAKKYIEMRRKEDPMLCLPDSDEVYEKYFELKQQLAESEKKHLLDEKEWQDYCAFKHIEPQIKGCLDREREYEKQLAEKEKELTRLKKNWQNSKTQQTRLYNNLKQEFEMWKNTHLILEENKAVEYLDSLSKTKIIDLFVNYLIIHNQEKISFAVEQLEKVKEKANEKQELDWGLGFRYKDHWDIIMDIDNQIKQLKEMK